MASLFDTLKKPITITGSNIDPRYFTPNDDGTYTPTDFLVVKLARRIKALAERQLRSYENEFNKVVAKTPVKEIDDPWDDANQKAQYNAKYETLLQEADKLWKEYRSSHIDEFEEIEYDATGNEDDNKFFAGYQFDFNGMSTSDLVSLYNEASEIAGIVPEGMPRLKKLVSKKEFGRFGSNLHAKVKAEINAKLGIPDMKSVVKPARITVDNYRFQKAAIEKAGVLSDVDESIITFATGLYGWLTENNPEDFKKANKEMVTLIDEDFILNFNDSAKDLKADGDTVKIGSRNTVKAIKIWTKPTEDESAMKIIDIYKENPTESEYKYALKIDADGESLKYNKTISTKADIRKALSTTIMMIEDVDSFKKYVPDIERIIDTL